MTCVPALPSVSNAVKVSVKGPEVEQVNVAVMVWSMTMREEVTQPSAFKVTDDRMGSFVVKDKSVLAVTVVLAAM